MLAAIHFGIWPPSLLHIAAGLLHHVAGVGPALEMSAAKLALGVFLIAGTLPRLLDFHFVMWKLLRSGGGGPGLCCGQSCYPRDCGGRPPVLQLGISFYWN